MSCKFCGGSTSTVVGTENMFQTREPYNYRQCHTCGHTNLANIPADMASHYPPNYYSLSKRSFLSVLLGIRTSLSMKSVLKAPSIKTHHSILDYGCGRGDLLQEMHKFGYKRTWGYDPYSEAFNHKVLAKFHVIMLHHVIEHLTDPVETLLELKSKLLPGGQMLLRLPVIDSYAYHKYKGNWIGFDAPRHINLFTRKSIVQLAAVIGMEVNGMYDDSSHFQFTASEVYAKGKKLSSHGFWSRLIGYLVNNELAKSLNEKNFGDQVVVLLRKS